MPADVIDEIKQYRSKYRVVESIHFDTYFVDPLLALNVAKQKNRVYCEHPTIDGLQLCYYRGELPEHGIKTWFMSNYMILSIFSSYPNCGCLKWLKYPVNWKKS